MLKVTFLGLGAMGSRMAATDHMAAIENNPERIKAFFKDALVAYAA